MIKNWIPKNIVFVSGLILSPMIAGVFYVSNLLLINRNKYIIEVALFVLAYGFLSMYVLQTIDQWNAFGIIISNAIGTAIMTLILWKRHLN